MTCASAPRAPRCWCSRCAAATPCCSCRCAEPALVLLVFRARGSRQAQPLMTLGARLLRKCAHGLVEARQVVVLLLEELAKPRHAVVVSRDRGKACVVQALT